MRGIEEKDIPEDQIIKEEIQEGVSEKKPFSSLELTWKSWYWYYLMLFNLAVPGLMALDRIVSKSNTSNTSKTGVLVFLCLFCPIIFTFLVIYMHFSLKNYRDCKVLIKDDRIKNFWRGITASCISFCFLLIALVSSYKLEAQAQAQAIVYTLMAFSFILGTASSAFISIFEFCVSFDIFYSKNKEAIIEQALKYNSAFKIKEEDWEEEEEGYEDQEARE